MIGRYSRKQMRAPSAWAFLFALASCANEPPEAPFEVTEATSLPVHGSAMCDADPPPPPSPCEWAKAVDEIAWGTLLEVRPVVSPAMAMGGTLRLLQHCDGFVEPAVDLVIAVEGSLARTAPQSLTVRVGAGQVARWNPWATREEDGGLGWRDFGGGGASLVPGHPLGVAYRHADRVGVYSLMGEALFGFSPSPEGARLHFQPFQPGVCDARPPTELEGQVFSVVREALARCQPSEAADGRRQRMWNVWGGSAENYYAAKCFPR